MQWTRMAVRQPIATLKQQLDADTRLLSALDLALSSYGNQQAGEAKLRQTRQEYQKIDQELRRANEAQANADLVETLQAARTYLVAHPHADRCPVCAKPEPHDALLESLNNQLDQLQHIQQLHERLKLKLEEGQSAKGAYDAAEQAWQAAWHELTLLLQDTHNNPFDDDAEANTGFATDAEQTLQGLLVQRSALQQRIDQAQKAVGQHNVLQAHLTTIDRLMNTTVDMAALNLRMQEMLSIVELERKRYVREMVNAISETVGELYRRIHPDEPLGDPAFGLKAKNRASLTLSSKFGSQTDVPPGAYYSESHLDTLGLCVYLALAKQSGNALVVLDDILMSVDTPHLDRIIDLISEEAASFGQVIITTHSRTWFDRMRQGRGMSAELIELYGWSLDGGMHHSTAVLAVDELRSAVHAPRLDRQAVASRAGILLEQLLDGLTIDFQCALPRKRPASYTLGELSQGVSSKLQKLLRTEHLDAEGMVFGF
ncbi:MAG: hypothetical protein HC802_23285 [Caldilineaceae bacterium]|nr:hypothetical protein [Caldilineaceae bacterium]